MSLVDKNDFDQTVDILRGKVALSPVFEDLKIFLKEKLGVTAFNFVHEKIPNDRRHRLYVLLSSREDFLKMHTSGFGYDPVKQTQIAEAFYQLAKRYRFKSDKEITSVFVAFSDFSEELKADANSKADREARPMIVKNYQPHGIWDVISIFSGVVVFFHTEAELQQARLTKVTDAINKDYFCYLKKYDEFKLYSADFAVHFDTKENLDQNFNGNLYYYFK